MFSLLAGGEAPTALRLGVAMFALQASIGAVNDLADVTIDRGQKPGKPLPRGVVPRREATAIAAIGLVAGLLLAGASGPATLLVAAVGTALGYLYDLRLSRTAWSWLPLAAALPLVVIYAWIGSTGGLPAAIAALVPIGIVAGGGLALANGLADLERDQAAGVASAAVRLGRTRAWVAHTVALAIAVGAVWWQLPRAPTQGQTVVLALVAATLVVSLGVVLAASGRPVVRERGWELEAIGVAAFGFAWVAGAVGA